MFTTIGKVLAVIGFTAALLLTGLGVIIYVDVMAPPELAYAAIGTGVSLLIGSTVIGILAEISQRVEGGAT